MSEIDKLVKVGYFKEVRRTADGTPKIRYISYKEYNDYPDEIRTMYRERFEAGSAKYFCACCSDKELPLTITTSLVIRVANNGGQENHKESCPKSVFYTKWLDDTADKAVKGVTNLEGENRDKVLFNISLPQLVKQASSSSSSEGTGTGKPRDKRTALLPMVISLNKMAWEKQTFSKKKEIKTANSEKRPQTWEYKDLDAFNRLLFGASSDISVKISGKVVPFQDLYYRKDTYYSTFDHRKQWFIYAVIEKLSEVKESRKYQYITLRMPSDKSMQRSVVRIPTEDFKELFPTDALENGQLRDGIFILSGYIIRKYFKGNDGSVSDWMQLTKGCVLRVNKYGLYCENERVVKASEYLADHHVIFTRPYVTLENYGNLIPTFQIERMKDKNVLIDYPETGKEYANRKAFGKDNEEYECICVDPNEDDAFYLERLAKIYGRKEVKNGD